MHLLRSVVFLSFVTAFAFGCTASGADQPTGATCPSAKPPSYASFGRAFFAAYCSPCHSADARDRHGAPPGLDFDTEPAIAHHANQIDEVAAFGPRAHNAEMPDMSGPVRTPPSDAARATLGEFLACEAAVRP
jgi:mono/diheme cytochrome c family protein